MDAFDVNFEQVLDQLRDDFLADVPEWLGRIDDEALRGVGRGREPILAMYREAHNLKGTAGSYGFRSVTLIAHRLEDYIQELSELDERHVTDIGLFVDRMRAIFESRCEPDREATSQLLRDLPRTSLPGFEVETPRDVEVLLVTPSNSVARYVQRELRACGYRVTKVETAWRAVEMAVCLHPGMVITAAVLEGMSGIDLIRALRAMTPTELVPVALLTSFSEDHEEFKRLPQDTAIIRLGSELSGELADAIASISLSEAVDAGRN